MTLHRSLPLLAALAGGLVVLGSHVSSPRAQDTGEAADETKPYSIAEDGAVDWTIYNGYRRYNSICYTSHGPPDLASSSARTLPYSRQALPPTYSLISSLTGGR